MTKERFHEAMSFYAQHCEDCYDIYGHSDTEHLIEMTVKAREFIDAGRTEKAMRWLGFIQGVLYAWGEFTIDELKTHVMPHGEEFKPVAR